MYKHWNNYSAYLKRMYGDAVYRIGIDGGFSCPNRLQDGHGGCSFCDGTGAIAVYQRKSESGFFRTSPYSEETATSLLPRLLSIEEQAERGREFLQRRYKAKLFSLYFQSYTNTYDSPDNLRRIYDRALSTGEYKEFIVSTRPDCLSDEVIELLASYQDKCAVWIELGLQSASDKTLEAIGRGHSAECWRNAALRVKAHGLMLSSHIIIGLPGEGRKEYLATVDLVNDVHSDGVKIHNLHIPGGVKAALVGESGAGKSTIVSLLGRFYERGSGRISIDGMDVDDVTQKSLHDAIGFVQQNVFLFDASIRENLRYGKADATDEEMWEALRNANLYSFVSSLPDGLDTEVGERGTRLSGGQKQRLSIARIFLKNPKILVFDEATSSLDTESEKLIQDAFDRLAEGRTSIVIAHRLSTIKDSDIIFVIDKGQVKESGSHEELLEEKGIYYRLYSLKG